MDAQSIAAEEERLRLAVRELSDSARNQFYTQLERQVKDPDTYAVLNYLFISGLHHFYLGNWWRGLINLAVFVAAIVLMFTNNLWLGIILLLTITVAELYALFHSQLIVREHNNRLMQQLLVALSKHEA